MGELVETCSSLDFGLKTGINSMLSDVSVDKEVLSTLSSLAACSPHNGPKIGDSVHNAASSHHI
jgi:hypothetical protein